MVTETPKQQQSLPPVGPKNDSLGLFLVQYMGYTEDMAREVLNDCFEPTKELAIKVRDSILADKTISAKYKEKFKVFDF